MTELRFRFGSWNLNMRRFGQAHIDFLQSQSLDVFAAQEASASFYNEFSKSNLFKWSVSSLAVLAPRADEGAARRCGVAIFGRAPFEVLSSNLLTELRFPERTLALETISPAGQLRVCSFHIPPGASWGKEKTKAGDAIANWLSNQQGNLIFGMDANGPKTDMPDPKLSKLWPKDSRNLIGPTPTHGLRDAYRVFLNDRPALFGRIRAERPAGPLATSHYRHRGSQETACRYDFIYSSPSLTIENVGYNFDRRLSDHALVVAQMSVGC